MGKSALALDIALTVAETGRPVLFVSAEMGRHEIGTRILARGGVSSERLLSGQLDKLDFERLERRRARMTGVPLHIDDSPGTTLLAIRSKARRLAARDGLGLVVVDYLQLVTGEGRRERRELEVAEVSRGLKALARELAVPVLALAQLNRAVELRTNKRPVLADLRESGQLEQDADVVLLLHRPEMYDLDADPGAAEVIVAKHRNGPTGSVHLAWLSHRMSFANAPGRGGLLVAPRCARCGEAMSTADQVEVRIEYRARGSLRRLRTWVVRLVCRAVRMAEWEHHDFPHGRGGDQGVLL